MKRLLLLFFTPFFSLFSFAQLDSARQNDQERKWEIGINFSPDYSYRILKPVKAIYQPLNDQLVDSLNAVEKGKLAFTAGISLSYSFNKNFSIRTGLYYSDKGIQSKGFVYANYYYPSYEIFELNAYKKDKFYFYELPVTFNYAFSLGSEKKNQVYFFLGSALCLNSQRHEYISRRWWNSISDPEMEENYIPLYEEAYSVLYVGYTAGSGIKLITSKRLNINMEPVFKYFAYKFYSENFIASETFPKSILRLREMPFSYSCNFRINYSF